ACLAMGLTLACSGGALDDDDQMNSSGDNNAGHDDTAGVGTLRNALLDGSQCQRCTTQHVCEQELVPCDPPVEVNGRQIRCLREVCRDQLVCTPCDAEGGFDGFSGFDPDDILDGIGRFPPIDPPPFGF